MDIEGVPVKTECIWGLEYSGAGNLRVVIRNTDYNTNTPLAEGWSIHSVSEEK